LRSQGHARPAATITNPITINIRCTAFSPDDPGFPLEIFAGKQDRTI
jgi:hypothetical protein